MLLNESEAEDQIKRVTVLVPDDLHIQLKVHCAQTSNTMNDCFLSALIAYLQSIRTTVKIDLKCME